MLGHAYTFSVKVNYSFIVPYIMLGVFTHTNYKEIVNYYVFKSAFASSKFIIFF